MAGAATWSLAASAYFAAVLCGYLLGSVPFGLLLTKLAGLGDIRSIGSGNIGATNVLRTGRKGLAAATLLLDAGKGAAAVLIAMYFSYGLKVAALAGFGAFLGHIFPLWLHFKGGKGVSTFLGVMLAIAWPVGVLVCLTWLAVAALFRRSSLAALAAAILAPLYAWALATPVVAGLALALAVVIVIRHHSNIRRLFKGEEPRIGENHPSTTAATPLSSAPEQDSGTKLD